MNETLDIGEVAARTGLSHRALRFYEARGLVTPLRTAAGRRVYGPGELARLHAVIALKRAGFSLAAIGRTLAGRQTDLAGLVAAQIADLDHRLDELTASRGLLVAVQSRIDRGEPIDVATLCSLIRAGDRHMEAEIWKSVTDRYLTPEEKAAWADNPMPEGLDQQEYSARWKSLGTRIAAALAMPGGPTQIEAEGFVREWFTLLEPFSRIATPEMWQGSARLYEKQPEWQGEADPGFTPAVWSFIRDTAAKMRAEGKDVGPLPAFLTDKA